MKIVYWSDFVCPFCYIGKRHLELALESLDIKVEVEVKSYELDPYFVREGNQTVTEMLAAKYGMSIAQANASQESVRQMAANVGLEYNVEKIVYGNTIQAHRLLQRARAHGFAVRWLEVVTEALFKEGADVESLDALKPLWESVGGDWNDALQALEDPATLEGVRSDENEAYSKHVRGVPYFEIDGIPVQGAQPVETFIDVLKNRVVHHDAKDLVCEDGVCMIG